MSEIWREPPTTADVQPRDATTLLRTLFEHQVEFVVVGGLAVAAHRRRLYEALRSLDDFVAMKRAAGRRVDELDLEELERVRDGGST